METKICKICGEAKPLSEFSKDGTKHGKQWYKASCKACSGCYKRQADTKTLDGITYKKCKVCGAYKPSTADYFEDNRNTCIVCRRSADKQRRAQQKTADIVMYKCREMAWSAHARVFAKSREYKKGYRHLKNPFGFETPTAMKHYLYRHFYYEIYNLLALGLSPSVDRIDTEIGYTPGNIRIIEFSENTKLGVNTRRHPVKVTYPDGLVQYLPSVAKCAAVFNTNEAHIRQWIKGTYKPRNKCKFEYDD